jgi:hypothetical protein
MMHQRRFTKEFEVEAVRQVQTAGEASVRSSHIGRTTAFGKGFGCRPGASGIPGKRAGVGKPPKNEPAGKR